METGTETMNIMDYAIVRSTSPSPDIPPSMALGACPDLDRSISTASTASSVSSRSTSQGSDMGTASSRRCGYSRPVNTSFAESARSRDSVMSLGSIAHMQYYFARTGLLSGKGAQLARNKHTSHSNADSLEVNDDSCAEPKIVSSDQSVDDEETWHSHADHVMLPPTVSTYCHKEVHIEPLPDMLHLRRQLREALGEARKAFSELAEGLTIQETAPAESAVNNTQLNDGDQGWHELQGLHLLNLVTCAIREAKSYYTSHTHPEKLYAIRAEGQIRSDLFHTLDVLKRMTDRSFRGGIRCGERSDILGWIEGIVELLHKEEMQEQEDKAHREGQWSWRSGDWHGRERERERLFLASFNVDAEALPVWSEPDHQQPSDFVGLFQSGLLLVKLHNEMVRRSTKAFGQIKSYYSDLNKPYRQAENLRYWAKAAELRWDVKISIDVLQVVQGSNLAALNQFDEALLMWCTTVREALTTELAETEVTSISEELVLKHDQTAPAW